MAVKQMRSDIDVEEFRKLLDQERAELLGLHLEQRRDMENEARQSVDEEMTVADINEPADVAIALIDRDRDAAQDRNILGELHEIDRALEAIANGTYGICRITGKPIPIERLRALPWATTTREAADGMVQ